MACLASVAIHSGALIAVRVMTFGAVATTPAPVGAAAPWLMDVAASEPTIVDLTSELQALPPEMASDVPEDAIRPEGDEARRAADATAGGPQQPRSPAPDVGDAQGRMVEAPWRRDRTTLRARLADGADVYHMPRDRSSSRASSPQPVRQEPRPGRGDARRSERPHSGQHQTVVAMADEGPGHEAPEVNPTTAAADAEADGSRRGEGPLDVPQGPRRYDAPQVGAARERVDERAASNEPRPGLLELTTAASAGPREGVAGRGFGSTPGATSLAAVGEAPTPVVARGVAGSASGDASTQERAYARQFQEIVRRVGRVLVFPRRLAVRLEQGESIVRFWVRSDGRLGGGVDLVKSAGFTEFDDEALSAVKRAAPFPPIGKERLVELRVPFQNPVVK